MSILLAGLIVAGASGAVAVGRWLARRQVAPPKKAGDDATRDPDDAARDADDENEGGARATGGEGANDATKNDAAEKKSGDATNSATNKKSTRRVEGPVAHLDGFPCQLGDVVIRLTGEEAWLAGGLVLSEDVPVAALFVAPDAGHDCALYVRPKPRTSLYWMEPLDAVALLVGGEPPSSVEHDGIRFDRARRLPLRPRRVGVGAPDVGDAVVVAEYTSAGAERLVVMKGSAGAVYAYRGLELEESSYEVIASGRSTLDD